LEEVAKFRKLAPKERTELDLIGKKIGTSHDGPSGPDKPTPVLKDELQKIFGAGISVTQELADKWATIEDTTVGKDKIKAIFDQVGADHEAGSEKPNKPSNFSAFITHATSKGGITAGANEGETFKTLITTKSPKEVIEMIIEHKLETAD